jgi:PAS domain S-box-containing protein
VHSANGDYVFASPNVERLFGWTPAQLVGRNAYELFHPDDLTRIAADHAKKELGEATRIRYRFLCANGEFRWVETASRARRNDGDGVEQILAFTRDVHDEELARDTLIVAERTAALGRLAAAIGHELANPLAAAWMSAEHLRRHSSSPERSILKPLLSSLQRCAEVINELRILGERPAPVPAELDLAHGAARIAKLIGVEVAEDLAPAPLRADPARVHQLVFHVLYVHGERAAIATGADDNVVWLHVTSDATEPLTALRADLLSAIRGEHRTERSTTRLVEALVSELGGTIARAENDGRLETRIALPRAR